MWVWDHFFPIMHCTSLVHTATGLISFTLKSVPQLAPGLLQLVSVCTSAAPAPATCCMWQYTKEESIKWAQLITSLISSMHRYVRYDVLRQRTGWGITRTCCTIGNGHGFWHFCPHLLHQFAMLAWPLEAKISYDTNRKIPYMAGFQRAHVCM